MAGGYPSAIMLIQQQQRVRTRGCQKPPAMLVANSFSFKLTIYCGKTA